MLQQPPRFPALPYSRESELREAMPPEDSDPRPVPPERPNPGDCCNSSCNPCIFDLYADALDRYQKELQDWEEREAQRKRSAK